MILQFSVPKTGSTLVCEILCTLNKMGIIKEKILKTHCIYDLNQIHKINWKEHKIITTIRHPGDTVCSEFNTWKRGLEKCPDNFNNFKKATNSITKRMEIIEMIKERPEIILALRYELFYNNFDYIYNELEKFLNIKINKEVRNKLNELYNRDNVYKFTSQQNYKGNLEKSQFSKTNKLKKGIPAHMSFEKGKENKYKKLSELYLNHLKNNERINEFCNTFDYKFILE